MVSLGVPAGARSAGRSLFGERHASADFEGVLPQHDPAQAFGVSKAAFWQNCVAISWIMVIVFFFAEHIAVRFFLRYREGMKDAYVFVGQVETKNQKGFRF